MTIYDALCCGGTPPVLTGEYAPAGSLGFAVLSAGQGGALFAAAGQRLARRFSGLPAALERLGGAPAGVRADLAWVLPLFAFLPVQLRFWRADEEFPAQLQFFWDRSTPQLLHYETLFYAAGYLVQRIEAALSEELLCTGGLPAAER